MATPAPLKLHVNTEEEERLKPPDSKTTRSPKSRVSSLKHKTRFPTESVKQSEESLRQLLDDFEHGRLNAFGVCIGIWSYWDQGSLGSGH